jgi:hypothetical protein
MRANLTLFGPGGEVVAIVHRVGTMEVRQGSKLALTLTGSDAELAVVDRWFSEEDQVLEIKKDPANENRRLITATGDGTAEILVMPPELTTPLIRFTITVFSDTAAGFDVPPGANEPIEN